MIELSRRPNGPCEESYTKQFTKSGKENLNKKTRKEKTKNSFSNSSCKKLFHKVTCSCEKIPIWVLMPDAVYHDPPPLSKLLSASLLLKALNYFSQLHVAVLVHDFFLPGIAAW